MNHKPPKTIDGANVLLYADVDGLKKTNAVTHIHDGSIQTFKKLAICSYGSTDEVYVFHCDENWETDNDDLFGDIDEAIESAHQQYAGLVLNDIRGKNE